MILALVRHGQTDYNLSGLIQGRIDNPLNDNGRAQAALAVKKLNDTSYTFDAIAASPLSRALETAHIINNDLKISNFIFTDPLFVERDFSFYDGVKIKEAFDDIKLNIPKSGYETDEEILVRVHEALNKLYKKYRSKKVVLCTHSHFIKSVLVTIDNKKFSFFDYLLENGAVILVNYDGNKLSLISDL